MSFPGAEKLLDFGQAFDVAMLDSIVTAFYSPGNPQMVRRVASARAFPSLRPRVDHTTPVLRKASFHGES